MVRRSFSPFIYLSLLQREAVLLFFLRSWWMLKLVRGWCSSARLRWASRSGCGSSFLGRRTLWARVRYNGWHRCGVLSGLGFAKVSPLALLGPRVPSGGALLPAVETWSECGCFRELGFPTEVSRGVCVCGGAETIIWV